MTLSKHSLDGLERTHLELSMEDLQVFLNKYTVAGLSQSIHSGLMQVHLHASLLLLEPLLRLEKCRWNRSIKFINGGLIDKSDLFVTTLDVKRKIESLGSVWRTLLKHIGVV